MQKPFPRIIVSGLRGGGGKTILSLSLCSAFKSKGHRVTAFKKGPDYIDAGWLAQASGAPCHNLDLFMMEPGQITDSFFSHTKDTDIAVIEGNRGLYDGMDHEGTYSTAELAKLIRTPVLIIIDCTKATNTIAAQILGCQKMDPDVPIRGVVLNNIATKRQEELIRRAIRSHCGLPVVGVIPRLKHNPFPERHMGLTPFQEHEEISSSISSINMLGMDHLDLDAIWSIASEAGSIEEHSASYIEDSAQNNKTGLKIGVIKDSAFQFYYPENIDELQKRGAEIIEISTLIDKCLPELDALYIGGGFPETNAIALSGNTGFKMSLHDAIESGLPVYAECGGLMYLGKSLVLNDKTYPMAGIFPLVFTLEKKPQAHGYTVIEVTEDNPFFKKGSILKGHEFHYSKVTDVSNKKADMCFNVKRGKGITGNMDGICYKNVLATYTHLHAIGSPEWADGIINCAARYKKSKNK